MRRHIFLIVLALSCCATPASAYVVGVEYPSPGFPVITNIYNVQIGTDFFDVSFDGSFGSNLFIGDEAGALLAKNALVEILNLTFEQYPPAAFPPIGPVDAPVSVFIVLTADNDPPLVTGYGSILAAGWLGPGPGGDGEPGTGIPSYPYVEAHFVAAPEPGSALLAGIGLIGLAVLSRRRV